MSVASEFSCPYVALFIVVAFVVLATIGCTQDRVDQKASPAYDDEGIHRFLVMDPGHFHAGLVFKRAGYKGISPLVGLYAPVGEDFVDHMSRVIPFNNRPDDPAGWRYRIHLGPDYREAVFRERFGDIMILSGRNDTKIDNIKACVDSGFHVLADKPWLIEPEKFPLLAEVLDSAVENELVIYDIMTERFEVTSILQRLIANHDPVFGTMTRGTPDDPAVVKSSVHHLFKYVSGQALKRPWWFFDTAVQGEGLVDITTHLADLVFWIIYPEQPIDYRTDIEMVSASRWPTVLEPEQFEVITGKPQFPEQFTLDSDGNLPYYCNGELNFRLRGINVQIQVVWNYQAPDGTGDTHYSIMKGTKAHVLVLQGKEQNFRPEVYIEPAPGADSAGIGAALKSFIAALSGSRYPGIGIVEEQGRWRIDIPDRYRVGHEAHFGQVTDRFLEFLGGEPMPGWEKANMLAKYYVTTKALEMAR